MYPYFRQKYLFKLTIKYHTKYKKVYGKQRLTAAMNFSKEFIENID
jgi:hypothetical protein